MRNLTIDIGNTITKTGIFENGKLISFQKWTTMEPIVDLITSSSFHGVIISSVSGTEKQLLDQLPKNISPIILSASTPLPIELHYKTINTLGVDRIAGVIGAFNLFPNQNNLVIDIGTCITFDFVSKENHYLGGSISPGLGIRLKALSHFTGKLPLVEMEDSSQMPALVGDTTNNSILSGVINGTWHEIRGLIDAYEAKYQKINTIITGGDGYRFESLINPPIFVAPKLVLQGLNCILEYNG